MPDTNPKSELIVYISYESGAKLFFTVVDHSIQSPLFGGNPPIVDVDYVSTLVLMILV
jgi:hypothetical protein